MADEIQGAPQPQPVPIPPTQNVTQFILTVNQQEFLLSCGHIRVLVGPDPNTGLPTAAPISEWLMTISLSPTTAEILRRTLEQGIAEFEKSFGKIPVPKTSRPTVSAHEEKPTAKA